MPDYRRNRVAGGWYCFTVNLLERDINDLLVRQIDLFREAVRRVRRVRRFEIPGHFGPGRYRCGKGKISHESSFTDRSDGMESPVADHYYARQGGSGSEQIE